MSYCQKCVNEWHNEYKQYNYFRRATAQVMRFGVSMELMEDNPMKKTILPRKKEDTKAPNFYSKPELLEYFGYIKELDNYKYYALFSLLAITGMRKSEALALSINDIDIKAKTLTIGKTIAIDEFDNVILQTPKTASSYRTIILDDETIKVMKKEMLILGFNISKNGEVLFPNANNSHYYPQAVNDWLKWIYYKTKKDSLTLKIITPYGFRHTACSLMFESAATISEVQQRLVIRMSKQQ